MTGANQEKLADLLGLPKDSSSRLCELRLAQVELETKRRELTADWPAQLEATLKKETDSFLHLKQLFQREDSERVNMKKATLKYTREAEFFESKTKKIDINESEIETRIRNTGRLLEKNIQKLSTIRKALGEFENLEPSNEALERKIEDLKKSRLSLEMTFDEEQLSLSFTP